MDLLAETRATRPTGCVAQPINIKDASSKPTLLIIPIGSGARAGMDSLAGRIVTSPTESYPEGSAIR
jgi:hypothetical protein